MLGVTTVNPVITDINSRSRIQEDEGTQTAKSIVKKKNNVGRVRSFIFKICLKTTTVITVVLVKDRHAVS